MFHTRRHPEQRRVSFHRAPQGAPPGTLVVDPAAPQPRIDVMAFDEHDLKEVEVQSVEELRTLTELWPVTWVNVEGLGDADIIRDIGALYNLHPLALEDVVHVHQRAKVDPYEAHFFIVLRMVTLGATGLVVEQLGLFLGEGFVLTFQERPGGDAFDPVRDRLRRSRGQIRRRPPDYLAYALLDAVVDGYFIPLEAIGDRLEALEEQVLSGGSSRAASIHALRRDLLTLRRAAWPLRDAINDLLREGHPLISGETQLYLRDCYDHCIQIVDLVESYRELTSGLMDVLLSVLNNRLSETMKVLTLIATVFMPLSFIAGLYGMNFDTRHPLNMPELGWAYGYPYALGLMGLVAGGMLGYFWRKGWLRDRER